MSSEALKASILAYNNAAIREGPKWDRYRAEVKRWEDIRTAFQEGRGDETQPHRLLRELVDNIEDLKTAIVLATTIQDLIECAEFADMYFFSQKDVHWKKELNGMCITDYRNYCQEAAAMLMGNKSKKIKTRMLEIIKKKAIESIATFQMGMF